MWAGFAVFVVLAIAIDLLVCLLYTSVPTRVGGAAQQKSALAMVFEVGLD